VIYCSLCVGLSVIGHNFEEAIFLTSTSKSRVIIISTILRQLIFRYEDSVHDPQTLVSLEHGQLGMALAFPPFDVGGGNFAMVLEVA
jgi:hypothetical protein